MRGRCDYATVNAVGMGLGPMTHLQALTVGKVLHQIFTPQQPINNEACIADPEQVVGNMLSRHTMMTKLNAPGCMHGLATNQHAQQLLFCKKNENIL